MLVDRDEDRLITTTKRPSNLGSGHAEKGYVYITEDVAKLVVTRQAVNRFGGIDILVSNAGVAVPGEICELNEARLRESFGLNFFAHYRIAKAVKQVFDSQGSRGHMLFNLSKQAVNPGREFGAYGFPTATLMFLVKQLALELGESRVRVNGVNADRIRSGLLTNEMIAPRSSTRGVGGRIYVRQSLWSGGLRRACCRGIYCPCKK